MSTAFSNSLSGLQANSEAINVVSGNLANENTIGYKANAISFEELVSEIGAATATSLTGSSVVPISAQQSFSQGAITHNGPALRRRHPGEWLFRGAIAQRPAGIHAGG